MPPKKKKGAVKDNSLESIDQLIKANLEIDALNRELAVKNDIIMRLQNSNKEQTIHIQFLEEKIKKKNVDQFDLTSDMSRQYKTMQSELLSRSKQLEIKNQSYLK